jgi:peroxiredoxin
MFEVDGMKLITLIARDGQIMKVFYPAFPPDRNADEVITWLRSRL